MQIKSLNYFVCVAQVANVLFWTILYTVFLCAQLIVVKLSMASVKLDELACSECWCNVVWFLTEFTNGARDRLRPPAKLGHGGIFIDWSKYLFILFSFLCTSIPSSLPFYLLSPYFLFFNTIHTFILSFLLPTFLNMSSTYLPSLYSCSV